MTDPAYESDAAYFELIAKQYRDADARHLKEVAKEYRSLARNAGLSGPAFSRSRLEYWSKRAVQCRVLAEQFQNTPCREQLERLAQSYELLAETSDPAGESF